MLKTKVAPLAIRYEVECEPDETPVRGNFMATEDPIQDRKDEDAILERLYRGDVWAWCCVRVWAIADNGARAASDWLSGCSYESEANYRECNDYFADQCREAADRLFDFAQSHRQGIQTKYLGRTDNRGARVKAWAKGGEVSQRWNDAIDGCDNHTQAAALLARKLGWAGRWIGGATPDGSGYLFVQDTRTDDH